MMIGGEKTMRLLEVCAGDMSSVGAAVRGGARRVELCTALSEGGITPSAGMIETARSLYPDLRINVLIRPRGGDFVYAPADAATMLADISMARKLGADGVVIGALTPDGDIDYELCSRMVETARGMSVTFHRAFDRVADPLKALEDIIALGCDRLLTSGQAASALEGLPLIKLLAEQAAGRIIIMPGCGVTADNAAAILDGARLKEIHASATTRIGSSMSRNDNTVKMGRMCDDADSRLCTSAEIVRNIIIAINR